jgi:hypothetical protein
MYQVRNWLGYVGRFEVSPVRRGKEMQPGLGSVGGTDRERVFLAHRIVFCHRRDMEFVRKDDLFRDHCLFLHHRKEMEY